jgi:hypothetical protein
MNRGPIPRKQFVEAIDLVTFDEAGEDVGEIGFGIDAVEFASLCRPPDYAERFW